MDGTDHALLEWTRAALPVVDSNAAALPDRSPPWRIARSMMTDTGQESFEEPRRGTFIWSQLENHDQAWEEEPKSASQ